MQTPGGTCEHVCAADHSQSMALHSTAGGAKCAAMCSGATLSHPAERYSAAFLGAGHMGIDTPSSACWRLGNCHPLLMCDILVGYQGAREESPWTTENSRAGEIPSYIYPLNGSQQPTYGTVIS